MFLVPRRVGRLMISPTVRIGRGGLGVGATAAISAECRDAGNEQFEGDEGRVACGSPTPQRTEAGYGAGTGAVKSII
jgi:hypothetical protein